MKIGKITEKIKNSIELDKKQSFSDKIYNTIAITLGSASLALVLISFIAYLFKENTGLIIWLYIFYPMIFIFCVSVFFSVKQVLRNRYATSVSACFICGLALAMIIIFIIVQIAVFKKVFVIPATMPSSL